MSQAGYTPIQLYYSTTAAAVPTAGNLASGELAINITDGKLYYKNNSGVVTLLAGATAGPAGGSNTQVQFNSSGVLAGSANMTFNGTTLTAGGLTSSGVLDVNGTTESSSITTGSAVIDGGVGIAKSLYVGGNATVTKDTGTSALRLQSLAPYAYPGDFTITAGGQSTPALTILDNTAAQERLNILTGETVFNEAGADQDFRIESDTQPNMFFLDAGNDRIGFKTNTPVSYLTVGGAYDQFLTFQDFRTNVSGTYDSYMAWQTFGTTPLLLGFTQNDVSNTNRRFFIKFAFDNTPTYYERMGINYLETVFNENSADLDFRVESDTNTHMLFVDASSNVVSIGSSATNAWSTYVPLQIGSSTFVTDTGAGATFSQFVHGAIFNGATWNQLYTDVTASRIELNGSSLGSSQNFYTANNVTAGTATTQILNLTLSPTAAVFNEDSRDIDFRVESDGNANMLFVDAGNNRVGVGTGSPSTIFTIGNAVNTPSFQDSNTRVWNLEFDVTENTNYQRFKITADATRRSCTVRIVYTPRSGGGNPGQNGGTAEFSIFRADGGVACNTISIFNAGGGGAASINLTVPTVSGNDVLFGFEVGNNGTGTNYTTEVRIELISYTPLDFTVATISGTTANTGNTVSGSFALFSNVENMRGSPSATIFNEQSADVDFRVESDANTHMLFVEAGANHVNIGTATDLGGVFNIAGSGTDIAFSYGTTVPNNPLHTAFYGNITGIGMDSTNAGIRIAGDTSAQLLLDVGYYGSGSVSHANWQRRFTVNQNSVVVNEDSVDMDFRVESDSSTHGLFLDAGQASVSVNTSSTTAFFNVQGSATRIVSQELANSDSQGTAQFNRIVKLCPSVSSNNKLIIPFVSQGSLNSNTVCRVMGHGAAYNLSTPYGFEITFAVGHLTAMYSLSYWGVGGNAVSAAINGQTVEITFTTAYNTAYGVSGGVFVTLEYMTNVTSYSIDVSGIVLN